MRNAGEDAGGCNAAGERPKFLPWLYKQLFGKACSFCKGTGEIHLGMGEYLAEACWECNGSGVKDPVPLRAAKWPRIIRTKLSQGTAKARRALQANRLPAMRHKEP